MLGSFPQFWIYGGALIFLLLCIVAREVFHVWRGRHYSTHRVPHLFNIFILLVLVLATYYGIRRFEEHRERFESTSLSYPRADYRAERQSLQFGDEWVYETVDTPETVIAFYKAQAKNNRYAVTVDTGTSSPRLLLERSGVRLFLTIINENEVRVLHYGKDGRVERITY